MGGEGIMDGEEDHTHSAKSCTSSIEDSADSNGIPSSSSSSSISDMVDDEEDAPSSSSTSTSSLSSSMGPLYDLSELMVELPIKRGLSKFYQGKSQSFTSLSRVKSIEDLPKQQTHHCRKKMKGSKSYAGGLHSTYKSFTLPKPIISKKLVASRGPGVPFSSSSFPSRRGSFVIGSSRPPLVPVQKSFGC